MRITYKRDRRRFVYNWKAGSTQVKRVMLKREQIWPDTETRVRTMRLDMESLKTGHGEAYWKLALAATAVTSSENSCVTLTVAQRKYCVNTGFDNYPVVKYSLGVLDFGEDGPPLQDVGSEVEVVAVVPSTTGEKKIIEAYERKFLIEWDMPLIEGCRFGMELRNFSRKRSTYSDFGKIKSLPSGTSWNGARGVRTLKHNRSPRTVVAIKDADVPESDTRCSCEFYTSGGCYYDPGKGQYQYAFPVWPAFKKVFRFKVAETTTT